ncbi:uncharacterized protein CTRU02_201947 [Colletotrichum truncatum]|uniref:Uncharacterized protein n=1 Tax=Colletotrichum truncatum TaxID=5467 RepID=A0ACC3ZIY5_COLTU|nr:uncharacterized protein CTRU02_07062 [Colletotrichum truncatum]KAF6791878.1 hypothetical protein CTRU02_07062 [Colletotrichum truncatum]
MQTPLVRNPRQLTQTWWRSPHRGHITVTLSTSPTMPLSLRIERDKRQRFLLRYASFFVWSAPKTKFITTLASAVAFGSCFLAS